MSVLFPLIFSLVALTIFSSMEILLIRTLNRVWWKYRWIRRVTYLLPLFGIFSIATWFGTSFYEIKWLARIASIFVAANLILFLELTLSLPFSRALNTIHHWLEKRGARVDGNGSQKPDENRRVILKGMAVALPLATLSSGMTGLARAFQDTRVYSIPMIFDNLPVELQGLKILHLSDSHLGIYRMLDDWEIAIAKAAKFYPDVVALTGDIADDLTLLPPALEMAISLKPKYGLYASLGNHEYYRGVAEVKEIYNKSSIPLLIGSGMTTYIGGVPLHFGGADDPRRLHQNNFDFLQKTIDKSLDGAPVGAFRILLCHRPEGFDPASQTGIDLTLSGHTHGGQVGFEGKSFFEPFMTGRYLWGKYHNRKSQMYLSSGIGHWFPFRLGCPPEAPIIELVSKS